MLRQTVTAWFLLATLLGPKACCCSLIAAVVARPKAPAAAPVSEGERRCCHDERPAPAEGEPTRPEAPVPTNCPCKVAHDQAALRVPTSEIEFISDSVFAAALASPLATLPATVSPWLAPAEAVPPILKPRLLLVLRC